MIVAPSILSANFCNLLKAVKEVEEFGAEFLHIDVMDGHFVPNITMGPVIYKDIRKATDMVFDVHLMIDEPLKYAKDFVDAGADVITFHYEACCDLLESISVIKEYGVKVGISIKPGTNISVLDEVLDKVDLVLVMSVEPGFGGQKFLDSALDKIKYLHEKKLFNNYQYLIEVDGGINLETAKLCSDAGCDILVAGTYIFSSENMKKTITELKKL